MDGTAPLGAGKTQALLKQVAGDVRRSELLQNHLTCEQALNFGSPLVAGNKVTLLQNGPPTYAAMMECMRSARDHINLETYIFDADEVGTRFAELLLERQANGVQVNLIYDSVGSMLTPRTFFDRLIEGGVRVLEFNPLNPLNARKETWTFNRRDHRKLLIIDGRMAFVGGVNISKSYSSAPSGRHSRQRHAKPIATDGWRDTHLQIEGPVVVEFQKLFLDTWSRQHADPLPEKSYFPKLEEQGDTIVRAIGSNADDSTSPIYLTLLHAICSARQQIHLTIAYFAPDRQLLGALTDAAKRGVDVQLVLPSHSDFWAIFHLGRSYYARLLRSGVKIHERQGSVMHAKTVCIDGVWSTVGSSNMDWRSFLHNDEVNAVVLGHDFALQMEAAFADDLKESLSISRKRWRRRSLLLRIKERVARIFAYWL